MTKLQFNSVLSYFLTIIKIILSVIKAGDLSLKFKVQSCMAHIV